MTGRELETRTVAKAIDQNDTGQRRAFQAARRSAGLTAASRRLEQAGSVEREESRHTPSWRRSTDPGDEPVNQEDHGGDVEPA